MKKITLLTLISFLVFGNMIAQQEKGIIGYNNWLNPWTEFKPNNAEYSKPTQILSGNITKDKKLLKRDVYLLLGDVFVTDNATLTIEPGTVIIGDFKTKGSLTISRGASIIAEGTSTDPIIFTSSKSFKKPGDWGGLFILGDAPTNTFGSEVALNYGLRPSVAKTLSYGGENPDSNSGILKYVRIEFAGKRTRDFGYFNALTLAGVGQQTIIENVMVSYCEGNSFNIMGGKLILDQMVSFKSNGNDYKFNHGAQVWIANSLAVRSPYASGSDVSRSINVKNYDVKDDTDFNKEQTFIAAANLTLINLSQDLKNDIRMGLVNEAIFIGADASFSIDMSVISGFNPAVILDDKINIDQDNLNKLKFTRTYFNNCKGNIFRNGFSNNADLENWYGSRSFDNVYSKGPDSETFIDANNKLRPDFRLRINGIYASNDLIDDDDD